MIRSILKKEFLKTHLYFYATIILSIGIIVYFAYNLNFSFATVEPESMMWYRFVHLEQKPYDIFANLFLILGALVAITQFVPERIKNRIKLMTHLPISMSKSLFLHLVVGLSIIFIFSLFLSIILSFIIQNYYPIEILGIFYKDFIFYTIGAFLTYLSLASAILERDTQIAILKFLLGLMTVFIFMKNRFYAVDLLWISVLIMLFYINLDSFYSIKYQRLRNIGFLIFAGFCSAYIVFSGYSLYKSKYEKTFNKYYIFYSSIKDDFIYQKNFGDHQFEYGIKDKETFEQKLYESYLPFVYWRNLDIQGKLPLHVNGQVFSKQDIKTSRLSFAYNPKYLQKLEVEFYPLINPDTNLGMIKFPEHMFYVGKNEIKVYNYDHKFSFELSKEINEMLNALSVSFPIKQTWGKATNMKPYDLGYLMLDSKGKLFNIKRENSIVQVKEVTYPKGIQIAFIKLSENKQKKLAGYAIDTLSNIYILNWDFKFKKLDIKGFDYKTMKFQFISNPLYYLFRFDDGKTYNAAIFSKKLTKIKEVSFKD